MLNQQMRDSATQMGVRFGLTEEEHSEFKQMLDEINVLARIIGGEITSRQIIALALAMYWRTKYPTGRREKEE